MSRVLHVVCPHCASINRLLHERMTDRPRCGRCHESLFVGQPAAADAEAFARHLNRNDIPVLVDFWAPWCAPCKVFAPVFEQAAERLEPNVRLIKLNTEQAPQAAAEHHIRSIPTLALFHSGRELARQSGIMDLGRLIRWVEENLRQAA
ncbi:thioredoxin TrxC [Spiribacter halobius]|uniref:Thioredoxin n=1 Tax=Sediminicurvatus halobius TaxID=2182432 RepID=A0A2U2N2N1_9GAMM|nr:thioredoxin TrxC [Spiribacter halobius]PWG63350.1 thiol reductase thioredoxin [Spiribacter halobius]UEX79171.1 thioredoxin TrxC [Spiribacter halobius]